MERAKAQMLHSEFGFLANEFAKKHGLVVALGKSSFGENFFKGKFELKEPGKVSVLENLEWNSLGVKPEMIGKMIKSPTGEMFELTGVKASRWKFPLQIKNVRTGKMHKAPVSYLKFMVA